MTEKLIDGYPFVLHEPETCSPNEMILRSDSFYKWIDQRRTVRDFADTPVPIEVIRNIIKAASTAPSGAHKQPWTFCVVSNPEIKKQIRIEAEKEEYESYHGRMSEEWLQDLRPLIDQIHQLPRILIDLIYLTRREPARIAGIRLDQLHRAARTLHPQRAQHIALVALLREHRVMRIEHVLTLHARWHRQRRELEQRRHDVDRLHHVP